MLLDPALRRVARKELQLFFSSPVAWLFLGIFVAVTLFIFFWVESFFSRNIADVRPMFEWMPLLLILLSAALTMRMWSEERRSGTLEHVMTLPADPWQFVLGKFAACVILLGIALLLTLPLPIAVAWLANLDWGPVISGYIATLLLGAAYLAIGLFVSSRADNQIVSLMMTVLLCGVFYLLGSPLLTGFTGNAAGELLRDLGTGSRFESITRGVLDIRDLYFYVAIVIAFLALNRYTLEQQRWAADGNRQHHRRWRLFTALVVLNALLANLWLSPLGSLRVDTTEGKIFSINPATRQVLAQLQEPLLIRGYFSAKTHPLLAPLVPELQDLLREYEEHAGQKLRLEFIDPAQNRDAEEEAGSKYGIRPTPFRIADRYQSAVVNSYFNLLIQYGDEYKVLGFQDLIEVKFASESDLDVRLANPEYHVTGAIRQVLRDYQSAGNLFDTISGNVTMTAYLSAPEALPESLQKFRDVTETVAAEIAESSRDKFRFEMHDPEAAGGALAQQLAENYGFQPMVSSLFDTRSFWFYLVLENGDTAVQISLPDDLGAAALKRNIEAALKRFASGFSKTVGLVAPTASPYAMPGQSGEGFSIVREVLSETYNVTDVDLTSGRVPESVDLLMLLAPEGLDEAAVFAVDQFLMRGGTVVVATAPLKAEISRAGLSARAQTSGLEDLLAHHGVTIEQQFVMDPQNAAFPLPVQRQVGGFQIQEIVMLDYPYFIDVREDGLNSDNAITADLPQITVPWVSPVRVDSDKNAARNFEVIVQSSSRSWLSDRLDISPQVTAAGASGFVAGTAAGSQPLAVVVSGVFDSLYAGEPSPLLRIAQEAAATGDDDVEADPSADAADATPAEVITGVIEKSPTSARLLVIGSNDFASDLTLARIGAGSGNEYLLPAQMLVNAVDWSLEDSALLSIRARGHFNRTLPPLTEPEKQLFELASYGLALLALFVVWLWRRARLANATQRYQSILAEGGAR